VGVDVTTLAGRGETAPEPGDAWIVLRDPDDVLVDATADAPAIVFGHPPVASAAPPLLVESRGDGPRVWAARVPEDTPDPDGARFAGARTLVGALDPATFARFARARMLVDWQRTHRFCGRCGAPTTTAPDEHAVQCPRCGLRRYPRISPVIIVRVTRGDEILLANPLRAPRPMYTVLAGFVEAGESLEQAVAREIAEEVGLTVGDLAYAGSQPWPFPHALMVAFTAQYVAGAIVADPGELRDAGWYRADALPDLPPHGSIARALIEDFRTAHLAS
jgi:NAD+ diphosphatase